MKSEETTHLLLAVGRAQIDAMFHRQSEGPAIDDSEFMPLVDVRRAPTAEETEAAIRKQFHLALLREPTDEDFRDDAIPPCVARVVPVIELHHHVLRAAAGT